MEILTKVGLHAINYDLPEERIALYPAEPRDSCRLLVVGLPSLNIIDTSFSDIGRFLRKGDIIVVNNSRVINARIKGIKSTGGVVEFLLLEKNEGIWKALGRPATRLKKGMNITIHHSEAGITHVRIVDKNKGGVFLIEAPEDILKYGTIPLPPYIVKRRPVDKRDEEQYQTVFSKTEGAVASPTSVLHFTDKLVSELKAKGISIASVTLHVGPGTFKPLNKKPDEERYYIDKDEAARINASRKICVCGTTAMRALETVYLKGNINPGKGKTGLIITPGYVFQVPDMFITNFHLPGTSLLSMVAAYLEQYFPGGGVDKLLFLYHHAIRNRYRFYSYGDAMILLNDENI
ncbi:tRNA preQ1(34) S-adenosylmethionine ribosyltransferase-isomerase QueA [Elusimicrobiota bacterium]